MQFQELVDKALSALKKGNKRKTKTTLKKLWDRLKEHQENLVIADTSPNGWLAVARLRNRSELPDDLRKKLERVDKEIWRSRSYGGPQKKFAVQSQGGGGDFRTRRLQQKLSPEELLYDASRQIGAGRCSHCKKENHFYRECPVFWTKVQEPRGSRQPTNNASSSRRGERNPAGVTRSRAGDPLHLHHRVRTCHRRKHHSHHHHQPHQRTTWETGQSSVRARMAEASYSVGGSLQEVRFRSKQVWRV
jgi:hypothetical protein